tara:strand:+ start:20663 stop:21826 length:1164 start_codon:yes stop_codon:yes gene_type:complete
MRVLTVFIDMLRPNRMNTFNKNINFQNEFDLAFSDLGGTVFLNCYSPGPDTPRSISSYLTGKDPYLNGCNTRLKWPKYFLKENQRNIFDIFIDEQYKMDSFTSIKERANGIFPSAISKLDIHNHDNNLDDFLSKIELKKKHFIFISIPDFHYAFDDFGYSKKGEKDAYKLGIKAFNLIFKRFSKDDFDHIFIFSDHGFKFSFESKFESPIYLLNEDRSNCVLIHRKKFQNETVINKKLCSLSDFYATYQDIISKKHENGYSFLRKKERKFIVIEDHINFSPEINQNIELWAVVTKDRLYLRTLNDSILIDKGSRNIKYLKQLLFDNILMENSSFKKYNYENEHIFSYKKNILTKSEYVNGDVRKSKNKFYKVLFIIKDIISYKFSLK